MFIDGCKLKTHQGGKSKMKSVSKSQLSRCTGSLIVYGNWLHTEEWK